MSARSSGSGINGLLVHREKIEGSNYFWSFPAKKYERYRPQTASRCCGAETYDQGAKKSDVNKEADRLADAKHRREEDREEVM